MLSIMELAETALGHEHRAAKELGIELRKLQQARKITHNQEIDIGRHPGQTLGPQRPPTPEELKLCEEVADAPWPPDLVFRPEWKEGQLVNETLPAQVGRNEEA
jgi:hypothetical protein